MPLHIYNTLSGQKEAFVPLNLDRIGIYVCGPTVYDMAHIGHARAYVAFDTVVRYLRRHYNVTYVRNYTDVDDKIIKRANELKQESTFVSEKFISEFRHDMKLLGNLDPDIEPKVTQHLPEIVSLIEKLIAQGVAYASAGDVYYAVEKFATYGRLARRNLEDMEAGARVEPGEQKRHPMDFALWKAAKPGEPFWDSPWGKGRPGWHIECSAMSAKYLGETFDIHGGGKDLVFPHHENEIAQSEAASKKTFVRYWMHNGFVNIDNEKMSKSLGNFFTVRDVLQKFLPQALRYFLLTTHYRSPINFSDQNLVEAENRVRYIYQTLARLQLANKERTPGILRQEKMVRAMGARFEEAMQDDFNTAKVLGDLSEVFKLINEIIDQPQDAGQDARTLAEIHTVLLDIGSVLGLFHDDPVIVLDQLDQRRRAQKSVDSKTIESLIDARNQARKNKDFKRADEIRAQLTTMGITIKDGPSGTTWEMS